MSLQLFFLQKILIIRFSSIGDIVLTSPVIRCLKLQIGAEVHFLTKKPFVSLLENNPHITKVLAIEKSVGEVLPILRKKKYDYIIDLHHNLRTFIIKWRLPFVKSYAFKKLNFEKWLLTNFKLNRLPKAHIADRYLETVKPLGVENDGQGLDFFLSPAPSRGGEVEEKYFRVRDKEGKALEYIALPIGAGRKTKALTIPKIVQICQKINYPIVLLGGKQEMEKAKAIGKLLLEFPPPNPLQRKASCQNKSLVDVEDRESKIEKNPNQVINLVGKCNLLESAAIVKNAKVVLTGDTGLMHIAAAFHKPIVSIWGNTVPEFGMTPYYPKNMDLNTIVEVKNLPCRPCSKIGYDDCPKGHFKCIKALDNRIIINKLQEIIAHLR